ncbi:MAG: DUF3788 domain-containing protein [Phycisphaerales bacterium]|nr:MAG: DUF3788 domain-containing protein [Phycisphaerales bacterium]
MAASVFDDKATRPTAQRLARVLGGSNTLWKEIRKHLKAEYGELTEDWRFYGQKSGWILKTLRKKRNLFFFVPSEGSFRISFVFGDRAVAAAEQSDLPKNLIETLKSARRYAEGRGLQIEVKGPSDVENIKRLVEIKINN